MPSSSLGHHAPSCIAQVQDSSVFLHEVGKELQGADTQSGHQTRNVEWKQLEAPTGMNARYGHGQQMSQHNPGKAFAAEDGDDEEWVQVSSNAFGAFIHVGLQADFQAAFITCGPMLVISLLIQIIFAEELITGHLPVLTQHVGYAHISYEELSTKICQVPLKLQVSLFLTHASWPFSSEPKKDVSRTAECKLAFSTEVRELQFHVMRLAMTQTFRFRP